MSVRASMANLISELRLLVGDSAGSSQVFSDDDLQRVLDRNREFRNYADLQALPEANNQNLTFVSKEGFWEADAKIFSGNYAEIMPQSADFINGRWVFNGHQSAAIIRGFVYDLNGAAVIICEIWMAKIKFDYDFSADSQSYKESQKYDHLKEMAKSFQKKAIFGNTAIGTAAFSSGDWYA